jgi:hypothetical protein
MPYVTCGLGAMPTGPATVNIAGTSSGPSYRINADGSTTWYDSSGVAISDMAAYNAAVNGPGDTGAADLGQQPISWGWVAIAVVGALILAETLTKIVER